MSIIPTVNPNPDNFVDNRKNLLGFSTPDMVKFFESINEKKFRAIQVVKWIHHFGVTDFEQMTNLSKDLRIKLMKVAHVTPPQVEYKNYSNDGTRKWVFKVRGSLVETVLISADDSKVNGRKTLCISSQVGCALECTFCSTGKQGFERNLTTDEIIGQLWVANQSYMEDVPYSERIRTVTNVVMMGMGEPLLNFNPVISSMLLMLDDNAYGMSKRRVTLSTSGVVPMMDKMNELIDVSLAISLHAPNDALRNELVPVNKKYPLEKLMAAAHRYLKVNERQKKHVTIEYVLLAEVNDTSQHAYELIELLKDLPCKINLIPFNPFPHAPYQKPSNNRIFNFQKKLSDAGFVCTVRQTRGDDIDAACGQLVGQVKDKTKRAKKWQESIETQSTQVTQ